MTALWLLGLLKRRTGRIAGLVASVALAVALLSVLALFLVDSGSSMTRRAIEGVPIDWQVEVVPSADTSQIAEAIRDVAMPLALHEVQYAHASGFEAASGGTVQVTGPGKVIAFDDGYLADFPLEVRRLTGELDGALIAQQTAANLHVGPGDMVTINRVNLSPVKVVISGVVDLPDADALFQGVGLPPQAAPQAPPDNVLVLPLAGWHEIFDPQQASRPDTTRLQFHVGLNHASLPNSPSDAYAAIEGASRNLELRVSGQALVSDNLGARLDAVRGDALYASILFLFLGLPGVALAVALTMLIASAGSGTRMAEQALLRVRSAGSNSILALVSVEALFCSVTGTLAGAIATLVFGYRSGMLADAGSWWSAGLAATGGGSIALGSLLIPAWRGMRSSTAAGARRPVGRATAPLWRRAWLDVVLLAAAGLLFWQSESTGYQVVLAPEGVPAAAVDYKAFLSPGLFWAGGLLLAVRLSGYLLLTGSRPLHWALWPIAGKLSPFVASSLSFQARRLTRGIAMTTIAVAFLISTAIFNATYDEQARVDAELTNGADVTVFGTTANPAGEKLDVIRKVDGAAAAEPMQHRFAYVGSDLQDIYGVNPRTLARSTSLSDAYFSGGTARDVLKRLEATPDGILVSEETVSDFQLQPGDRINLRLISAKDHQYHPVPFKFIGVAREFPTAPRDSFLVANSRYIAQATSSGVSEYVLMRAAADPAQLARNVVAVLGPASGLTVKDIGMASHLIGSSLTAINLSKLTTIELSFGAVMAVAATGLMLGLGFLDRRRNFAILTAIGASRAQLSCFLWCEGIVALGAGFLFGLVSGTLTAWMLVKLLTGVFDPPPEVLSIPWQYLGFDLLLITASVFAAIVIATKRASVGVSEVLRGL